MASIPDETLLAYVDGELPEEEAARVAEALTRDPEAAELVRQYREAARLLAEAYDRPMRESPPPALRAAVERVDPGAEAAGPAGRARPPRRRRARFALPLAASVALAAGLVGGLGLGLALAPGGPPPPATAAGLAATPQFQRALETTASGAPVAWDLAGPRIAEVMPLLTFRDERGRVCREYQSLLGAGEGSELGFGIACRGDAGVWRPQLVVAGSAGRATPDGGGFLPASGADPAALFRAFVDDFVGDRVLAPAAERRLLESGWRED
jgi:hypothetical protein